LVVGRFLLTIGALGAVVAVWRKAWWPLAMLAQVPVFFVWSFHSGGAVLTLPELGRWGLYNTRYAIAVLPLAALAAGAVTTLLPRRTRGWGAVALAVLVSLPMWIGGYSGSGEPAIYDNLASGDPPSICWQEARANSYTRRAWTVPAAQYLAEQYRPGAGVIFTFGSGLAEVLRRADIPLRQGLHEGNGPAWDAAVTQPEKFLREEWALAIPGDTVSAALISAEAHGLHYQLQRQILVKGPPIVEIYHRQ
jgi:hypothetical protein